MIQEISDFFGLTPKPTGLPTPEGVAMDKAHADGEWPEYFGEGYFHQYWQGNRDCPSGCFTCGWVVWSAFFGIVCAIISAVGYYNAGISNLWCGIWMSIAVLFPGIVMGIPVLSTRWTRHKIYRKYFDQYSIPRVWNQTLLPIVRDMIAKQYDPRLADLEASLKPLQVSLARSEAEKKYASSPENPVTDRGATLENIDKIIIETKAKINRVLAKIGDAKIAKDLAMGKIDEFESETTQMSHGDDMSKIDVLGVVNSLASGAGLAPVALPSEAVNQSIIIDALLRDEIRENRKVVNPNIIQGKDDVDLTKVVLPTSGTAAVKA